MEGTISAAFEYKDIMSICEKDNSVWLNARNRTVIRIYKDAFVDGTWDECKSLLHARKDNI